MNRPTADALARERVGLVRGEHRYTSTWPVARTRGSKAHGDLAHLRAVDPADLQQGE
jgi:hypothetical protein